MSNKMRIKARMLETMQDFIESNKLGGKIARQKLGKTPRAIVVEKISSLNKLGRTGILILNIEFNSEEGPFEGSIAIKEFSNVTEANRLVQINDWLSQRIQNNPRVKIPQIFLTGGRSIVYEGIEGLSYEESKLNPTKKIRIVGNAIATFHSAHTNPVNEYRYHGLLNNLVKELPISQDRKQKLLSFGISFLTYYSKKYGGVISYGDFHPGNILISPDGETSYLIDPEFIESEPGADRFEDISNFLIFDAYMEFLNDENLNKSFEKLRVFLDAYDNYLYHYDTNLNNIYEGTQWLALIFHLGLISLMKGAVAAQSMKSIDTFDVIESAENPNIEEIIQSYRLCREIWYMGIPYLSKDAIPRTLVDEPIHDGYLITWPIIHNVLADLLKYDDLLGLLFKFPSRTRELTLDAGIKLYKCQDKKSLQNKIDELNDIIKFESFSIINSSFIINTEWKSKLGLLEKNEDWKESALNLFRIWRLNPINMLVSVMVSFQNITLNELEISSVFDKKDLKNVLKKAEERKIITLTSETIILNGQWRFILGIPYYFDTTYFD